MQRIFLLAMVVLACAVSLGALAQGPDALGYAATKSECEQKANSRNFGGHYSERHRFVLRCMAGLLQR